MTATIQYGAVAATPDLEDLEDGDFNSSSAVLCSMFLGKSFYLAELKFARLKKNKRVGLPVVFKLVFQYLFCFISFFRCSILSSTKNLPRYRNKLIKQELAKLK